LARIEQMEVELERRESRRKSSVKEEKDDEENQYNFDAAMSSKSPKTPVSAWTDEPMDEDLQVVDRLEGEFDSRTARKIRNFFSRDASYTRHRILEMCCEEDDVLIDVLLELLMIETALRRSNSRLAKRVRYLFDPFLLLHDFIELVDADHSLLLDWIIGNETSFTEYLIRFCKRMTFNWHPTSADAEQVNRVMGILIRLRMHIHTLHECKLLPFSPKPLLKAMEKMEFCYESSGDAYSHALQTWTDVQTGMDASKKNKANSESKQSDSEPSSRSKQANKVKVSSLFLQDVKSKPGHNSSRSEILNLENVSEDSKKKSDKGHVSRKSVNEKAKLFEHQIDTLQKAKQKQHHPKSLPKTAKDQTTVQMLDEILIKHKQVEGSGK
ncbi:hypothetical protein RFI_01234, partial [Reticulomyxa filosa]